MDQGDREDGTSLYRNRAFVILWAGGIVSGVGSSMSILVFPLVGYALTQSMFLAGVAATGVLAGELLAGVVSGPLVDRWATQHDRCRQHRGGSGDVECGIGGAPAIVDAVLKRYRLSSVAGAMNAEVRPQNEWVGCLM